MDNRTRACEYYKLIGEKNGEKVKDFLHPDVEFRGPFAHLKGKEAVFDATFRFMESIESLVIRATFSAENQAMVVYDIDMPPIAKKFPGASLLTFREGLISNIELFYDGSRFMEKKEEIFKP